MNLFQLCLGSNFHSNISRSTSQMIVVVACRLNLSAPCVTSAICIIVHLWDAFGVDGDRGTLMHTTAMPVHVDFSRS